MKKIVTMAAAVACALALTACGGGGDDGGSGSGSSGNILSRADEGIWSNLNDAGVGSSGMQAVILSDGSYWGIYGSVFQDGDFSPSGVLHGAASIDGGSVSGAYTNFSGNGNFSGTYSGIVSAQKNLNLIFNESSDTVLSAMAVGGSFNMNYESIYNQPVSLSAIEGNYLYGGYGLIPGGPVIIMDGSNSSIIAPSLTISGSGLTLKDQDGNAIMTGTLTPHGTTVNVFDVSLTADITIKNYTILGLFSDSDVSAGAIYKGILFQTSSGILKNKIEIVAAGGSSAFSYIGKKQD